MKRNLSYATRMYCCDSLENLTKAVKNVVPHHFNIHENCGDWCQCVGKKPEEMEKLRQGFKKPAAAEDKLKAAAPPKLQQQPPRLHQK